MIDNLQNFRAVLKMYTIAQIIGGQIPSTISAYLTGQNPDLPYLPNQLVSLPPGVTGTTTVIINQQSYDETYNSGYLQGSVTFYVGTPRVFLAATALAVTAVVNDVTYLLAVLDFDVSQLASYPPEQVTLNFTRSGNSYIVGT